jgi:uncharacterized linocin/CFP29 family protein
VLKPDGSVDDRATAALVEIALPVTLSRQQIQEEDLSSALLQFRRRATQLGQLEDWFIFNGTYSSIELSAKGQAEFAKKSRLPHYRPKLAHLNAKGRSQRIRISGTPKPIEGASQDYQIKGMRQRNPGSLGLIGAPRVKRKKKLAKRLDNDGLMKAIVGAINSLEDNGYVAPYVCVFGRNPFEAAFESIKNSTVLPRDRIEPLIGRELLHASGIDILPQNSDLYNLNKKEWPSRGVLLSMANDPIDLALAAEATPEFRQVDLEGRYVFFVFERFALRIKDAKAIVPLIFKKAKDTDTDDTDTDDTDTDDTDTDDTDTDDTDTDDTDDTDRGRAASSASS